jgi:hypothetical protein
VGHSNPRIRQRHRAVRPFLRHHELPIKSETLVFVSLDPGFQVALNSFFTVDSLVGVTPESTHAEPENPPGVVWIAFPAINEVVPPGPNQPPASNVSWTFLGTPIINPTNSGQEVYLGEFDVVTTTNFPNGPPVPSGTIVNYAFNILTDQGNHAPGGGSFPLTNLEGITSTAVPEPSSAAIVLLVAGTAGVSGLIVRRRQRRRARTA